MTVAVNPEVVEYIKEKFNLVHLSDLELEYMLKEIAQLTKTTKYRAGSVPEEVIQDVKQSYLNGMPSAVIMARHPQYGKSTITRFITEVRREHNITDRNY